MSHGFQILDRNGRTLLDSKSTGMRWVYRRVFDADFQGTHTISDYDSSRGVFFLRKHLAIMSGQNSQFVSPGGDVTNTSYGMEGASGRYVNPTLAWNNSTKKMTHTPATASSNLHERRVNYELICLHYI